jgi:hypothetical protein
MKRLMILGLALSPLVLASPSQAQPARCLPAELIIAKARAERPSTEILARLTGDQATSLLHTFSKDTFENPQAAEGDEITVLRTTSSDAVLVIVAEEGCAVWRAELSRSDYEHATWKAFGLPV